MLAQDFNAYERGLEAQLAGPFERLGADRPVDAARTVIELMRGFELERLTRPNIFLRQKVGPDGGDGQTTTTTITVSTTPWAVELKQFKLMGISMKDPKADSEAILLDSRDNKMYFVRLGNAFPMLDGNVRLDDVEAGRARFTDGATSVELK